MKEIPLAITFNCTPRVRVRSINTSDSRQLKKEKKKFPFKLDNDVIVTVYLGKILPEKADIKKMLFGTVESPINGYYKFCFVIKRGYIWNGADIPKPLWWIGSSKDNAYLTASLVHDYMLEYKNLIYKEVLQSRISVEDYRLLTSLIFRQILKDTDTNTIKANVMAWCVDVFQKTFNRKAWDIECKK